MQPPSSQASPSDPRVEHGALGRMRRHLAFERLRARMFGNAGASSGRYELYELLGRGGFGSVYRARDHRLQRDVAIKFLHVAGDEGHDGTDALVAEARAIAHVHHANVVRVFDVGRGDDGRLRGVVADAPDAYLVMEYLRGDDLDAWLRRGPSQAAIVRVLVDLTRGLAACHAAGLLHRDLKPANILVHDGVARLVDFGLATAASEDATDITDDMHETGSRVVLGTPYYMAPEILAGAAPSRRADQYSLAVTAVDALARTRVFASQDRAELAHTKANAPSPGELRRRGVPAQLARPLARALAADPLRRHADTESFLRALEGADLRSRRRRLAARAVVAIGAAAAVTLIVGRGTAPSPAACLDAGEDRTARWTAEIDDVLGTRATTGDVRLVEERMREHSSRWRQAWYHSCEASDAPLQACVERSGIAFDDALALLARGPTIPTDRVLAVLAAVAAPEDCNSEFADLAGDLGSEIRTDIARARLHLRAGEPDRATQIAAAALSRATGAGSPAVEAEARFALGLAAIADGDIARGRRAIEDAYFAAAAIDHGALARSAAIRMIAVAAHHAYDDEAAGFWARQARAAMQRPPTASASERGALAYNLGLLARVRGRTAQSEQEFELARRAFVEADDPLDEITANAALGSIELERDDPAGALARLRDACERFEAIVGPEHPELARLLISRANAERAAGDRRATESSLRRAEAIAERHGDELTRGLAATNLAILAFDRGDLAEATARQRQALTSLLHSRGDDHPHVATARDNLGVFLRMQGSYDEACALHRRALDIRERDGTPRDVAVSLNNLGRCRIASGDLADAERLLTRARWETLARIGAHDPQLAEIQASLGARALAGGDADEAVAALEIANALWTPHAPGRFGRAEAIALLSQAYSARGDGPRRAAALDEQARDELHRAGYDDAAIGPSLQAVVTPGFGPGRLGRGAAE